MSLLFAIALAFQNIAQPGYAQVRAMPVPVVAHDVTDRPYRVIAEVRAEVTKPTRFSPDPSEAKLAQDLWKKARPLGADAVVNARYGEPVPGGWMWGRRRASGQAIKFLSDVEITERAKQ
jgi:hypothetical protein